MNYVAFECGGDAAVSGALFIKDIEKKTGQKINVIGVDRDREIAYLYSKFFDFDYFVEEDELNNFLIRKGCGFLPLDEHCRRKIDYNKFSELMVGVHSGCSDFSIELVHDKSKMYEFLSKNFGTKSFLPKRYYNIDEVRKGNKKVVYRENLSSGSKAFKVMKAEELKEEDINEHSIVTEFIPKEFIPKGKEYVVDFVATKEEIEIYPRETFYLKNGADTYIRLLEYCSEEYMDILHCCKEIITSLKYEGVGMIQLMSSYDGLKFIEMGCRISGASFVNFELFGWNPLANCFHCINDKRKYNKDIYYSVRLNRVFNI